MRITTAAPEEWSAAFELALRHLGADIRPARVLNALTLLAQREIKPEGIFVARGTDGLRGVQVCVPLPGASGLFWLPRSYPPDPELEDRLVQAALDWLTAQGAKIAQAFLSDVDVPAAGPFLRRGFVNITQLVFLEHRLGWPAPPLPHHIRFIIYNASNKAAFHATLSRTYEGTLDCPELNGVRAIDEVIAGHAGQAGFRPDWWWLALEEDRPVGVAMAAAVPDENAWDLGYVGVVPEARRRGTGRALVTHVLRQAQAARASKLLLAVDARNAPARQLYERLGFVSVGSREVYLQFLRPPLAAATSPAGGQLST